MARNCIGKHESTDGNKHWLNMVYPNNGYKCGCYIDGAFDVIKKNTINRTVAIITYKEISGEQTIQV